MTLVKSLLIKGSTDFGKVKADLEDVAVRTRKVGEMSPTIKLGVDDGAATLKLAAFRQELRSLKDAGSQSGLTDLAARLKAFGNESTTTRTKMAALKLEADALKSSMGGGSGGRAGLAGAAGDAQGAFAALAGTGAGGMGALIGAGVALSGQLTTVAFGLGGLGIAAAGVIGPVLKASQSAGGLQKAWAKLDPLQRHAAGSLITLKADYHAFQSSLKPEILTAFSKAVQIGGNVLHDIQPVSKAAGLALGQFLGQFGATLQDPEWRQFWAFMARTAPEDMRILGKTFLDLVNVLPPLLQDLQPLGHEILVVGGDAAKAAREVIGFYDAFQRNVPISNQHTMNALRDLDKWTVSFTNHLPGGRAINDFFTRFQHGVDGSGNAAAAMVSKTRPLPVLEQHVAAQTQNWAAQQNTLNTALTKGLQPLQNYIGVTLTEHDDLKNLNDALKLSAGRIGYKTQTERNSFAAAQTYIDNTTKQASAAIAAHKGIDTQIRSIENALPVLERVKGKTKDYRDELSKLRNMLDILRAEKAIGETIHITGAGDWSLSGAPGHLLPHHRPTGRAAGWKVPGYGGGDRWPVLVEGGETIVPKHLTPAVAPLMKAHGVPGFAAGGIAGHYKGTPGGLRPWTLGNWDATISGITNDIGNAMSRSFMSALASASPGGFGIPASGPLQSYARSLLAAYGWSAMWPQFNDIVMRESGWNVFARNPSSGAYGIPQALPAGKMASAGADWATNGFTQLRWMMGYIKSRWGDPWSADLNERTQHWYGGGFHGWFDQPTLIGVGERGRERVDIGGGGNVTVHVHAPVGSSPAEIGRTVAEYLAAYKKNGGMIYRPGGF